MTERIARTKTKAKALNAKVAEEEREGREGFCGGEAYWFCGARICMGLMFSVLEVAMRKVGDITT
jgi:hypothetical protein